LVDISFHLYRKYLSGVPDSQEFGIRFSETREAVVLYQG